MTKAFLLASLLAIASFSTADIYNPTRILRSGNSSYAYLFDATAASPGPASFRAININTTFEAAGIVDGASSTALPFFKDGKPQAYTPILDANGQITVVVGDCLAGAAGTKVWRFSPDPTHNDGSGFWVEANVPARTTPSGATYLAGGISFSQKVGAAAKDINYYVFGGMCPWSNATSSKWTSQASYYDAMLTVAPGGDDSPFYRLSTVGSIGQPIAEAGFSMTGLAPSITETGNSNGQKQSQQFLLLGGHTRGAFLNMSQVALFALPQQSWAFFPVDQPPSTKNGISIDHGAGVIEPRSGHTAVLSEDGSYMVIFGGWVGDITNPAQPQLAVLRLGPGYGGNSGDVWAWKIPDQSGTGLDPGTGLYGHGATMLPGNVMMIAGGYSIAAPAAKRKRDALPLNSKVLLYNVTSNEWLSSYTSPYTAAVKAKSDASNPGQQAILGVGIGLGVLVAVAVIILGYWYAWRRRHQEDDSSSTYISSDKGGLVKQASQPFLDRASPEAQPKAPITSETALFRVRDRADSDANGAPPVGDLGLAGSTGRFVEIPSPTRGLRKNLANRPYMYHAAPRAEDHRVPSYNLGAIHPIVERDDEDDQSSIHRSLRNITEHSIGNAFQESERKMDEIERSLEERPVIRRKSMTMMPTPILDTREPTLPMIRPMSDPFVDSHPSPLGSNPISPTPPSALIQPLAFGAKNPFPSKIPMPLGRQPLAKDSVISENWTTYADDEPNRSSPEPRPSGRNSPAKTDERTNSTLSERSRASNSSSAAGALPTRTGTVLSGMFSFNRGNEQVKRGSVSAEILSRNDTMSSATGSYPSLPASRFSSVRTDASSRHMTSYADLQAQAQALQPNPYPELRPSRPVTADESTESLVTSRSNFSQLQSEGENLLGRHPSQVSRLPMPTGSSTIAPLTAVAALNRTRDMSPSRRLFGTGPPSPVAPLTTTAATTSDTKLQSKGGSIHQTPRGANQPPITSSDQTGTSQAASLPARDSSSASSRTNPNNPYSIAAPSVTPSSTGSGGGGWVSSLRRALTAISVSERSFTTRSVTPPPLSFSTTTTAAATEISSSLSHTSRATTTTTTNHHPRSRGGGGNGTTGPRRTASAGSISSSTAGRLLKEKRGQRDWPVLAGLGDTTTYLNGSTLAALTADHNDNDNEGKMFIQPSYFHADPDEWGIPRTSMDRIQAEGEWDVEGAAACRDVQMLGATFTVPKSRLRVVNADVSGAGGGGTPERRSEEEESRPLTSDLSDASPPAAIIPKPVDPTDRSRTNSVAAFAAALSRKDSQRSISDSAVVRQESLRRRQAAAMAPLPVVPIVTPLLSPPLPSQTTATTTNGGSMQEKMKARPAEQYDGNDWGDDDVIVGGSIGRGRGGRMGFGDRSSVDSGLGGHHVSSSALLEKRASGSVGEGQRLSLLGGMGMGLGMGMGMGSRRSEAFDDAGVVGKVGFLFGKKMV